MQLRSESVSLPYRLGLAKDYIEEYSRVESLFSYNPWDENSYILRAQTIDKSYGQQRSTVAEALKNYNQQIGAADKTMSNIDSFAAGAYVVITGQQAGIFTGPLYTIYKAITTVNLAKKLSLSLGKPVVPVFWVAAEDHDYGEINHTHILTKDNGMEKLQLPEVDKGRFSIGHLPVDPQVDELIKVLGKNTLASEFQPAILDFLIELSHDSETLAEWFAGIMQWLFKDHGLILANPLDRSFRQLEIDLFDKILAENVSLSHALDAGRVAVEKLGYLPQLQVEKNHANLFIYINGERIALYRRDDGHFTTREGNQSWSYEELIELCQQSPEVFSPNVVTRPLTQDLLFPTIAYVAGPGELGYYGMYKAVYQCMGTEMPIIYPRVSATLIEPAVARLLEKYDLAFLDVVEGLADKLKILLGTADEIGIHDLMEGAKEKILDVYQEILIELVKVDPHLEQLGKENMERVIGQISFLEGKAQQKHRHNCDALVKHFRRVELALVPNGNRQERVLNIFPFLIKFGPELINQLVAATENDPKEHQLIYLG